MGEMVNDFHEAAGEVYTLIPQTELVQTVQTACPQLDQIVLHAAPITAPRDKFLGALEADIDIEGTMVFGEKGDVEGKGDVETAYGIANEIAAAEDEVVINLASYGGSNILYNLITREMDMAQERGVDVVVNAVSAASAGTDILFNRTPGQGNIINFTDGYDSIENEFTFHAPRYFNPTIENAEIFFAEDFEVGSAEYNELTAGTLSSQITYEENSVTGITAACSASLHSGKVDYDASSVDMIRLGGADTLIIDNSDLHTGILPQLGFSEADAKHIEMAVEEGGYPLGMVVYREGEQNPLDERATLTTGAVLPISPIEISPSFDVDSNRHYVEIVNTETGDVYSVFNSDAGKIDILENGKLVQEQNEGEGFKMEHKTLSQFIGLSTLEAQEVAVILNKEHPETLQSANGAAVVDRDGQAINIGVPELK